jgi:hypothetical protein
VWRIGEIVGYVFTSARDEFERQWLARLGGWVQVWRIGETVGYVFASAPDVFERQWLARLGGWV